MKVSVVIPNYNGENLLKKNLPKVLKAIDDSELIVVDDASSDNSIVEIKNQSASWRTKIKLVENKINLGFSPTVNRGVREATGEVVILLNSDVVPEKGFLKPLLSHFKEEKVFAVGCMDKSIENGKVVLRGRGTGFWKRGFLTHARGEVDKNTTLWVSGGSGVFRKSIWDKLGGMDEIYTPFYWEDIDLSYRAIKSGYKILFEPKSVVTHEHEKGAIKTKFSQSKIKSTVYRNQFIFAWKNLTDINLQITHLFWLPFHLISAIVRRDRMFLVGFFRAFLKLPDVIKSGSDARQCFIKSDKEVVVNENNRTNKK
jgi:GT2 family glycosyltransferase